GTAGENGYQAKGDAGGDDLICGAQPGAGRTGADSYTCFCYTYRRGAACLCGQSARSWLRSPLLPYFHSTQRALSEPFPCRSTYAPAPLRMPELQGIAERLHSISWFM